MAAPIVTPLAAEDLTAAMNFPGLQVVRFIGL